MSKKIVVDFQIKGLDEASKSVESIVEDTKTLKEQFREASKEAQKLAGAEIIDQKALEDAIAKTADLKDRMNDVNEQVGVLTAGSKFERMSNNLGDIGSKIASLDFEGANESATRLLKFSKAITFGDAVKGIKDMGSTFLQLGKALLVNPLFLLGAVIAGIVIAIGKALDKLGVLKKITEAVGAVFSWLFDMVTEAIASITDFFGITSEAERELAASMEATAIATQKAADSNRKKTEESIIGIDAEIERANIQGKNTEDLERKKMALLRESARLQAVADKAAYEAAIKKGELTKEELLDLKEKARLSRLEYATAIEDSKTFETKITQDKKDETDKRNSDIAAKNKAAYEKAKAERIKSLDEIKKAEQEYYNSFLTEEDRQINAVNEKYNKLIASAKKYGQDTKILQQAQFDEVNAIEQKVIADTQAAVDLANENKKIAKQKELDDEKAYQANLKEILAQAGKESLEKAQSDLKEKIAIEQELKQTKLKLAGDAFAALGSLAGAFSTKNEADAKKQFNIQKAFNLASAFTNTALAVTGALTAGGNPLKLATGQQFVEAGIAATVGAANIIKIASAKFGSTPSGGGGGNGIGGGSNPSSNITSPQLNAGALFSTGGQSTQTIGGNNSNAVSTAPIKAFVVEMDISEKQARAINIKNQASI